MSGSPDFELLTSLRYDPQLCTIRDDTLARCHAEVSIEPNSPFYVLELHKDRLLAAAAYFKERSSSWSSVPDPLEWSTMMTDALSMIEDMQNSGGPQRPLKIRILCTPAGIHKVDVSATPPVSLETLYPSFNFMEAPERPGRSASVAWMVRLDTKPTAPSDYTMFKTTSRDMYDEARKRAGIVSFAVQEEVLLYNHNNEIMEGSLTTVYFYRDGHWCTPPESSGGLPGTTRRWALDNPDLSIQQRLTLVSDVVDGEVVWLSNGVRGFFPGQINLCKRSPLEPKTDES